MNDERKTKRTREERGNHNHENKKKRETEHSTDINRYLYIYRLMTNRYRNKKKNGEGCENDRGHPLTGSLVIK